MPQALCFADWPDQSERVPRSIPFPAEKAAETGNSRIAWLVVFILCFLGFFPALLGMIAGASGCAVGPLLIFYGIAMALPGLDEIQKDEGFLWQVGIPFVLALGTLAHGSWLQTEPGTST